MNSPFKYKTFKTSPYDDFNVKIIDSDGKSHGIIPHRFADIEIKKLEKSEKSRYKKLMKLEGSII